MRAAVVLLLLTAIAVAAPPRTLRGVVIKEGTNLPVGGASVLTERGEIAVTDVDGYFAITVTDADRELTVVATGYDMRTVRIVAGLNRIDLSPSTGAEVIEVTGKAPEQTKPLSYGLSVDEIRSIPG